uniref:Protein kinase domain-containing protein n=1 Tax=Arcella intermedia TaxID=1963864 RepID=A0A6B2LAD0_9EUKA
MLGVGTFGHVHRVRNKVTKAEYAMKVLKKSAVMQLKQVEHLKNEKDILLSTQHPFIIRLYKTYVDSRNIYLLMELSGGEFFSLLRSVGRLDKESTQFFAAEMVLVLDHLHSRSIVYRDLKPENVLLGADGHIKICDFGFAKVVTDRTWTLCGTPEYLAPEVIMGKGHDKAVDWWALGVLLFEMFAGYPPFFGQHPFEIYEKICEGVFKFPSHFNDEIKDLVSKLLTSAKARRLGNLRGGSQDVKSHPFFNGVDWEGLEKKQIRPPNFILEYLRATKLQKPMEITGDKDYDLVGQDNSNDTENCEDIFKEYAL